MEKTQKVILIRLIISSILFCFSFFKFLGDTWSFIISILSFALIGFDVVIESIVQIFKRKFFDEKFLMVIASIGAFAIGEFHEAVAVMLLYQLGEFLQDLAVDHSKNSIEKLINIMPSTANIEKNGKILKVSPSSLNINDEIIVFAGERVPLDGVILSGKTSFDTSTLTGESLPKSAEEGDEILAGFLNLTETITVKVTKTFESSSMSQILKLVKESEKNSQILHPFCCFDCTFAFGIPTTSFSPKLENLDSSCFAFFGCFMSMRPGYFNSTRFFCWNWNKCKKWHFD